MKNLVLCFFFKIHLCIGFDIIAKPAEDESCS